jgi:hypothetical protein
MATGNHNPAGFKLTEEEAFALLAMCLTSPHGLDATSEQALRKLAEYCISTSTHNHHNSIELSEYTASSA